MEINTKKRLISFRQNEREDKRVKVESLERDLRIQRGLIELGKELNRRSVDVIYNYTRGAVNGTFTYSGNFFSTVTKIYDVDVRGDRAIAWYGQTTVFYGMKMFFRAVRRADYNIWAPLDEFHITVSSNPDILGDKVQKLIVAP